MGSKIARRKVAGLCSLARHWNVANYSKIFVNLKIFMHLLRKCFKYCFSPILKFKGPQQFWKYGIIWQSIPNKWPSAVEFALSSRLLALFSQSAKPQIWQLWNMVQNSFFLNLQVTEDLCCWKSNKQLLLLHQVESEICSRDYEIKATCLSLFYLKKCRFKRMKLFQVTQTNGRAWAHPDLLTHRLVLMLALPLSECSENGVDDFFCDSYVITHKCNVLANTYTYMIFSNRSKQHVP